jgi:hypothetical protein
MHVTKQATCSQRGTGLTMTTLVVKPDMDCGLKMVEKMEAEQAIKYQRQVRKQVRICGLIYWLNSLFT